MTVVLPGVGVISRKSRWKQVLFPVEIPASRLSCLTSGSFRPKLGLCILGVVLLGALLFVVVPFLVPKTLQNGPFLTLQTTIQLAFYPSEPQIDHTTMAEAAKLVAVGNDKFASALHNLVKDGKDNVVLSSFSIETVMSMLMAGAKGETLQEILKGMSVKSEQEATEGYSAFLELIEDHGKSGNFTLSAANRIYAEKSYEVLPEFLEHVQKNFHAEPVISDFAESYDAVKDEINEWVSNQTNQKIKDLIKPGDLDPLTKMVLVNALYFKGDWANKFDATHTSEADFFVDDTKTVKVQMMRKKAKFAAVNIKELDAQALRMPYKGDTVDMIYLLPNKKDGLKKLEDGLENFNLAEGLSKLQHNAEFIVQIPKFKAESTHDLKEVLMTIGMKNMFDEAKADFSGMTKNKDLYVSKVMQKAFIEVNEEGAEAAAATGAVMAMRMATFTPEFECNHPFMFLIRERSTGMTLFSGRVMDPSVTSD